MITEFIAIDFETANNKRTSAVSVGVVPVENGVIQEDKCTSFLIRPPKNDFNELNTQIHGLTWEDVKDAPTFKELWDSTLGEMLNNKLLLCHNASMDKAILEQSFDYYGIDGEFRFLDTMNLATNYYDFENNRLATICKCWDIDMEHHHDPLCDARTCAKVALKMFTEIGDDAEKLIQAAGAGSSAVTDRFAYLQQTHQKISGDALQPDFENVENKENPFYKKKVVISGIYDTWPDRTDLAKVIKSLGADIDTSVTAKTNILIAGSGVGPKKLEKMQANIDAGKEAVMLNEMQLLKLLNESGFNFTGN